uniref:Uncharacterized protein n=1 Tax=Physcomitrium patens TaxID=3218 RepID=A0A2K1J077_PHYPA|nr:hypothetical protein PHYPA_022835 [Physcomitrium patens]
MLLVAGGPRKKVVFYAFILLTIVETHKKQMWNKRYYVTLIGV